MNRNSIAIKHTCSISHYIIHFTDNTMSALYFVCLFSLITWHDNVVSSHQLFVLRYLLYTHYTLVWRSWSADVVFIAMFMCGAYTSWGTLLVDAIIDFSWKLQLCLKCYNVLFIKSQRGHSEELLCDLRRKSLLIRWWVREFGSCNAQI